MNGDRAVVLRAPAKLTWSLRVTGVRDDGLHLVDAEMTSLDLCDTVEIVESGETSLEVVGTFADGVPTDRSNLVWRALEMVGRTARVRIAKEIPHGGGLGGGSTDAAAVLRWAGVTDPVIAARIGADVAFCLVGGRARVRGIGDVVEPLPGEVRDVTLVIPPLVVPTARVYARWDAMGGPTGDNGNDLEPAAVAEVPELAQWRDRIAEATGVRPRLAGSGATWFLEGRHDSALLDTALAPARVVTTRSAGDTG